MEHRLTSEAEVFSPSPSARCVGRIFMFVASALAGVGAWIIFGMRQDVQNATAVSVCLSVLSLAMIIGVVTDFFQGRNLQVRLDNTTLTVMGYSSKDQVKLSEITKVIDSCESTVIVTSKRRVVVDDIYFRTDDDKARFLKLLQTRLSQ